MIKSPNRFAGLVIGTLAGGALALAASTAIHAETADETALIRQDTSGTADLPRFTPAEKPAFDESFAPFAGERVKQTTSIPDYAVDIASFDPKREEARKEAQGTSLGTGVASYYGKRFHGRMTANGEYFDMNAMTAAHKTLPFGTRLRVTNQSTGKSVIVRINDRGPYIRGREIDLSRKAAEKIGLIKRGHGTVKLERL